MFRFLGKLALLIGFGSILGAVCGLGTGDAKLGVAVFLIFAISFRRTVFE